jgi:hypothetical protein
MKNTSAVPSLLLSALPLMVFFWPMSVAFVPINYQSLCAKQQRPQHKPQSSFSVTSSLFVAQSSERKIQRVTIPDLSEGASKFRRLKDLMWVREAQEDLTAAQFAISIDASTSGRRKQKRAIDYDNILNQLDRRIRDLVCVDEAGCEVSDAPKLKPGKGSGSIVYTETQRDSLLKRLVKTREDLLQTMKSHVGEESEEQTGFSIPIPEITLPREDENPKSVGPKLYVRDDGTVDWDGALQDRSALQNFGTAVWARINGQNPEFLSEDEDAAVKEEHGPKAVTVKIEETDDIRAQRAALDSLKVEYDEMEQEHTALLNSALKAGQAVANINLATLEPSLRSKIRLSTEKLEKKSEELSYQTLIYELERIYTYLSGELGNPDSKGYIPLQDRLNVAEFGLLESQVDGFNRLLEMGENVDKDVLAVVLEQVTDFKRRLGIDYYVTGFTFDLEAIQRWLGDLLKQTRAGLAFYVKGCELFWNDIVFSLTLIGRALQGYTLKPREVRNLRRTFKDIITFIPVIIILIIPLSPVGHVMVFGAIQRFFPDFFPSCFTERRQNLLNLYESTEYTEVTIDETWNEKLARVGSAISFFITSSVVSLVSSISGDTGEASGESKVNGGSVNEKAVNDKENVNGVNGNVNGSKR